MYDDSRRSRRPLFLATFIVVALFAFDFITGGLVRRPVRAMGAAVAGSAASVMGGITKSGVFVSKAQLAQENDQLKQQVAGLQESLAAAQVTAQENKQLQALVHLAAQSSGIAAPVLSSFKTSPYGTFLIGAGAQQGVKNGALVVSAEGFVLGRVRDAQMSQSLVTDIFAPGESIDVLIGNVPVTLQGIGGGNSRGDAPRGAHIATGTPVLAPALRQRAVGFVARAVGDEATPSVQVYVRTPVNTATLSYVYVETTQ